MAPPPLNFSFLFSRKGLVGGPLNCPILFSREGIVGGGGGGGTKLSLPNGRNAHTNSVILYQPPQALFCLRYRDPISDLGTTDSHS